jgi:hypothetical protein
MTGALATVIAIPGPQTVSKLPQTIHLEFYQGDDFRFVLVATDDEGNPYDLTGAVPMAQIRQQPSSPTVSAAFDITVGGDDNNEMSMHLPHVLSTKLAPGRYVWDCQITQIDVTTLCAGNVTVNPEVTR